MAPSGSETDLKGRSIVVERPRHADGVRPPSTRGLKAFQAEFDFSLEAICTRMLERHRKTIRTQKPHVAVTKLMRIVETTLTLANRKGFHSMSLRDLAQGSGLSMGALYTYFDSKETLLLMILGEVSSAVAMTLGTTPPSIADDPVARLRWLLETHVYLTETMQPWFAFSYMEAKAFPKAARDKATAAELETETLIASALADGTASGLFIIGDIALTASLIKPLLQDWYVKRGKYRRRGVTPEHYVQAVTAFVGAAIGYRPRLG
ncbi:TetR/AcrR family transcriptional regulator [Microvirga antarctica]|uniref:TetR/AcrR family transcriptional regulator n=1 Tax=Microvirga antarctica TaxID=2819233 RepID=UPI001B307AAD|nr:TetR/AcrR family transcriptional regulator [Microvirga antarctica]